MILYYRLLGGVTKSPPKLTFARGQVLAAARRDANRKSK